MSTAPAVRRKPSAAKRREVTAALVKSAVLLRRAWGRMNGDLLIAGIVLTPEEIGKALESVEGFQFGYRGTRIN